MDDPTEDALLAAIEDMEQFEENTGKTIPSFPPNLVIKVPPDLKEVLDEISPNRGMTPSGTNSSASTKTIQEIISCLKLH